MKLISSDIYECPGCLKFNANLMRCDLAENVPECTYRYQQFNNTLENTNKTTTKICTGPGKFPVPYDRTRYYDCNKKINDSEYLLRIKRCPQNKLFSVQSARCRKSNCVKPEVDPRKCGKNHYSYDQYDCRKFFHCQGKEPKIPLFCPSGYIFNGNYCQYQETVSFCNWEELKKYLYKPKK